MKRRVFGSESLVISVPARDLAAIAIPGSIFDTALLANPLLPADLRLAVDTVKSLSGGAAAPLFCVARPEMFTHGRALSWLREKIGGATDHICLSDGESAKLIPELRNHLFTYGLHSHRRAQEFKRLLRRAPELLEQFDSQVNSFHRVGTDSLAVEPAPTLAMPGRL